MNGPRRVAVDIGNSRMKWGEVDRRGRLGRIAAIALEDERAWAERWKGWKLEGEDVEWAVASVNPPVLERLQTWLNDHGSGHVRMVRNAADTAVRHRLLKPEATGADRALAVLEVVASMGGSGPAQVVLCGTAITVELIDERGVWLGGAIAPGLRLLAESLNAGTAQLPEIEPEDPSRIAAFGAATREAIAAGVGWGAVGAVRELLERQAKGLGHRIGRRVWSGGDARWIAAQVDGAEAVVHPELVLAGLARTVWGTSDESH